jgi:hypothetical protein
MLDAWRTSNWKEKFLLWFKPTGYRPQDVAEKYPVEKIQDVYNFDKYETRSSLALNTWSWVQLMMILLFVAYLFGNIALIKTIDTSYIFWYGAFIFLSVYALTELMDRNPFAIVWELLRSSMGLFFLYQQEDWFGATKYLSLTRYILGSYFILSIMVTAWFVLKHYREDGRVERVDLPVRQ